MSAQTNTAWRCHAKPAALAGKTCGHLNMPGECIRRDGQHCCSECGCTRIAGTDRYKRTAGQLARLWIVEYEVLRSAGYGNEPVKVTVVADGADDAFAEARIELGEAFDLGLPISAKPVVDEDIAEFGRIARQGWARLGNP